MEEVQAQISRNRRDRADWHAWLDRFNSTDGYQVREEDLFDSERDEFWFPPPDAGGFDLHRRLLQVA